MLFDTILFGELLLLSVELVLGVLRVLEFVLRRKSNGFGRGQRDRCSNVLLVCALIGRCGINGAPLPCIIFEPAPLLLTYELFRIVFVFIGGLLSLCSACELFALLRLYAIAVGGVRLPLCCVTTLNVWWALCSIGCGMSAGFLAFGFGPDDDGCID